ncbi:uncharacterized protein PV09_06738 [Verruconis gallopava]|uniref:Major facilitator superfamily (MFS) profile domain-containing protein n=1 Tax=Verruconis gallopava TaxID=253628 RepID=A0A0D2A5T1_9PEZI|nr:uncharacterized protein PV09_06738 [Verruconis gallopava]KIW01895.1 hypothetical protein PV09_06738 [Verruconis gallopava]
MPSAAPAGGYERVASGEDAESAASSSAKNASDRIGDCREHDYSKGTTATTHHENDDSGAGLPPDQGEQSFSPVDELQVLRKLDKRVVLFVAFLYLLSFLDRSNIGNARIAGMEKDLNLSGRQYDMLLTAFYITYILFEWMALLFRLIRPHIYLASCVMAWGLLASLQSISSSYPFLLVLRGLLGISEAAFAGVPFYLSFFFRNDEMAARVGIFISAAPLATAFASSLAWLITWFGEKTRVWAPWRLLLLVEGFPSIVVAFWVWNSLPDSIEEARFLTKREKEVATARIEDEKSSTTNMDEKLAQNKGSRLKAREIFEALTDAKCYLTAVMFFSINVAFSSMPVFLPTIIKEMGWSSIMSQALSAPPYLVAFVVVLYSAHASDKAKVRSPFIMFNASIACLGYLLIFLAGLLGLPSWVRYLGVYPATAGFFACVTLIITWTLNIQESDSKKGTGVAMLQYFGQMGPLLGTRLYPKDEGPLYLKGMAVCAGFMALVGILALCLRWKLQNANLQLRSNEPNEDGEEDVELLANGQERRPTKTFTYLI